MSSIIRGAGLGLALGLTACIPPNVDSTQCPDAATCPEPPPLDEKVAKADLDRAISALAKAEADGRLDPKECKDVTTTFRAAYQKKQPATANALFNAGVVWERCGNTDEAKAAYRDTIAARSDHSGAHNNLGVLQWNTGELREAAKSFQRAVDADANSPAARNNLAAALRHRYLSGKATDDFDQAELALRNALAVDSDNATSHENLARLYYDRGRAGERSYLLLAKLVVSQGTKILERNKQPSAELANIHGLLLMEDDNQVMALRAFKRATQIDPDHPEAHLNIAMIALRFRDYATAEQSLVKALDNRQHRQNVTALLGLGVAQRGLRRYDDAEKTLVRARKIDDRDPRALYNLGILYHEHIAPNRSAMADPGKGPNKGKVKFNDKPYLDAKRFFDRFAKAAKGRFPQEVADARQRIASIDQFLEDIKALEDLEREQAKLEALMKAQQQEERERLLDLERRAKQAASQGT